MTHKIKNGLLKRDYADIYLCILPCIIAAAMAVFVWHLHNEILELRAEVDTLRQSTFDRSLVDAKIDSLAKRLTKRGIRP